MIKSASGFTLIELVMVILIVGILAAVAIPEFVDFRADAKNAATKGALGTVRAAIAISRAAIALREDAASPRYPTLVELNNNAFNGSHPVLSGRAILDQPLRLPINPWTLDVFPLSFWNDAIDCTGDATGEVEMNFFTHSGWCYDETDGRFWANSYLNGSAATENGF